MDTKYKTFANELFITSNFVTNNPTVIEVFTKKEKEGREENQAPYKPLKRI